MSGSPLSPSRGLGPALAPRLLSGTSPGVHSLVIPFSCRLGSRVLPALLGAAAKHRSCALDLPVLVTLVTTRAAMVWKLQPALTPTQPAARRVAGRWEP